MKFDQSAAILTRPSIRSVARDEQVAVGRCRGSLLLVCMILVAILVTFIISVFMVVFFTVFVATLVTVICATFFTLILICVAFCSALLLSGPLTGLELVTIATIS